MGNDCVEVVCESEGRDITIITERPREPVVPSPAAQGLFVGTVGVDVEKHSCVVGDSPGEAKIDFHLTKRNTFGFRSRNHLCQF